MCTITTDVSDFYPGNFSILILYVVDLPISASKQFTYDKKMKRASRRDSSNMSEQEADEQEAENRFEIL